MSTNRTLQENLKRTREKLANYKRSKKANLDFIIKDLDKLVLGSSADPVEYPDTHEQELRDNESMYTTDLKSDLNHLHSLLNTINKDNSQKMDELGVRNQNLEQELLKLKREKEEMDKFVDKHYDELEEIRMRNLMLERDLQLRDEEIKALSGLEKRNIELENELINIKHSVKNNQQADDLEFSQNQIKLDLLQSELVLHSVDESVHETLLVNQRLQQNNNELLDKVSSLEIVVANLQTELKGKESTESGYTDEIQQLKEAVYEKNGEIATYLVEIDHLKVELNENRNTIAGLEFKHQELLSTNQSLVTEIEALKEKVVNSTPLLQNEQFSLPNDSEEISKLKQTIEGLETKLNGLSEENWNMSQQIMSFDKFNAGNTDYIKSLEYQVDKQMQQIESLKKSGPNPMQSKEEQMLDGGASGWDQDGWDADGIDTLESAGPSPGNIAALEYPEAEVLQTENDNLKNEITSLKKDLEIAVLEKEEEIEKLKKMINHANEENYIDAKHIHDINAPNQQHVELGIEGGFGDGGWDNDLGLPDDNEHAGQVENDALKSRISELEFELQNLRSSLTLMVPSEEYIELERNFHELQSNVAIQKEELDQLRKLSEKLENINKAHQERIGGMQMQSEELLETLRDLTDRNTALKNELLEETTRNASNNMFSSNLMQEKENSVIYSQKSPNQNRDGGILNPSDQPDMANFQVDGWDTGDDIITSAPLVTIPDEVLELRARLQENEEYIQSCQATIEANTIEFESISASLRSENASLQHSLAEKSQELNTLKSEVEALKLQLQTMQRTTGSHSPADDKSALIPLQLELTESEERILQLEEIIGENYKHFETVIKDWELKYSILEQRLLSDDRRSSSTVPNAGYSRLQTELNEAEERISTLEQIINSNNTHFEEVLHLHKQKVVDLEEKLLQSNGSKSPSATVQADILEAEERITQLEDIIESNNAHFKIVLESENQKYLELEHDSGMQIKELNVMLNEARDKVTDLEQLVELNTKQFSEFLALEKKSKEHLEMEYQALQNERVSNEQEQGRYKMDDNLNVANLEKDDQSRIKIQLDFEKQLSAKVYEYECLAAELQEKTTELEQKQSELDSLATSLTELQAIFDQNTHYYEGLLQEKQVEIDTNCNKLNEFDIKLNEKTDEIQTLEAKVQELESNRTNSVRVELLETELSHIKENNEKLRNENLTITEEKRVIQVELDRVLMEIDQMKIEYREINQESTDELGRKISMLEERNKDLFEELEKSKALANELEQDLLSSKEIASQWETYANTSLTEQDSYYQGQISDLAKKLEDKESLEDELKTALANSETLQEQLEKQAMLLTEVQETAEKLRLAEDEFSTLKQKYDHLESDFSKEKESMEASLLELNRLADEKLQLERNLDSVREEKLELETHLQKIIADNDKLKIEFEQIGSREKFENLEFEKATMEKELLELQLKLRDSEDELLQSKSLIVVVNQLSVEVLKVDLGERQPIELLQELGEMIKLLRDENELYGSMIKSLETNKIELEALLSTKTEQEVVFESKISELETVVSQWQEYAAGLETEYNSVCSRLSETETQVADNNRETEVTKSALADVQQENSQLMETCNLLQSQLKELESQASVASLAQETISNLEKDLKDSRDLLEAQNIRLNEIETLQARLMELESDKQQSEATVALLNDELAQLQAFKAETDLYIEQLDGDIKIYKSNEEQALSTIDSYISVITTMEAEKDELCKKVEMLENEMKAVTEKKEQEFAALNDEFKALQMSFGVYKTKAENLESTNCELSAQLEHLQADAIVMKDNTDSYINQLIGEIEIYKNNEQSAMASLDDYSAAIKSLEQERDSLFGEANDLRDETLKLKEEIYSLKSEIETLKTHTITMEENQKKTVTIINQETELMSNLDEAQNNIMYLQQEVLRLESQLKESEMIASSRISFLPEEYEELSRKAALAGEYISQLDHKSNELQEVKGKFEEIHAKYLELQTSSATLIQQNQEEFDELARLYNLAVKEIESYSNGQHAASKQLLEQQQGHLNFSSIIAALEKENSVLKSEADHLRKQVADSVEQTRRAIKLESELSESRKFVFELESALRMAKEASRQYESRCFTLESDLNHALAERDKIIHEYDEAINQEREMSKQMLNYKIQGIRSSYDAALEDMNHRHIQLEQILDETENTLAMERESFHRREQALIEELSYTPGRNSRSSRFVYQNQREVDLEKSEILADLQQAHKDNKALRRQLDNNLSQFTKEKFDLLRSIEDLKNSSNGNILETNAGLIIQQLQHQKNEIEFQLSKKEEKLMELEALIKKSKNPQNSNVEIMDLEKQKKALEKILFIREEELSEAQQKISALMTREQNNHGKDSDFDSSPIKKPTRVRNELASLVRFTDEIAVVLIRFFDEIFKHDNPLKTQRKYFEIQDLQAACDLAISEFATKKKKLTRLQLFKADLVFQKTYLKLQVKDLESRFQYLISVNTTMKILLSMGIHAHKSPPRSLNRLMVVVTFVRAAIKLKRAIGKPSKLLSVSNPYSQKLKLYSPQKQITVQ